MRIKKIISLFTALCFLCTFAGQNLSWASQDNATIKDFKKIFDNVPEIPAEYGKVTSIKDFGGKSVVVNIQDLHCHPEAQKHIARIIEVLDKNYNVKKIFVEGAYGKIDASWLTKIENKEFKENTIENMFEQGRLNASEYYGVKNNRNSLLFGLENEKKHKENIVRLGYILDNQAKYANALKEVKKEIDYLGVKYTNDRNKRFNRLLEKYKTGKISPEKFYPVIGKYIKNINEKPEKYNNILPINISTYLNIEKYIVLTSQNSKLNARQVYSQLESLLGLLKNTLPYGAYTALCDETDNLSNMDVLSVSLTGLCEMFGIDLSANYKELNAFLNMQALNRTLNPVEMLYEEKDLIEKLRIALSYDQTENEVAFLSDFYLVFADYLENKLLPEDYDYFSMRFNKFRELYAKYTVVDVLKTLENDFALFNAYYNLNNERNKIFVDNMLKNWKPDCGKGENQQYRSEKECLKKSEEVIIVVTGGYHSKGLQELLNERKITNITITPSISSDTKKSESLYAKIIKEQSVFLREALAFTIASQAATTEQFTILTNAGIKFLEKSGYSQETVDLLTAELLRALGSNAVKTFFSERETVIEFENSSSVTIQNNNGKLSVKESIFGAQEQKSVLPLENKDIFSVSKNLIKTLFINSAGFLKGDIKPVFEFILEFFIQVSEKVDLSDGLDYEVNKFITQNGISALGGIKIENVQKLPAILQKMLLASEKSVSRFDIRKLKNLISKLNEEEQKRVVALIADISQGGNMHSSLAATWLIYEDLKEKDIKAFEKSSPAAIMRLAESVKEFNPAILKTAQMLVDTLWIQSVVFGNFSGKVMGEVPKKQGNEIFEKIKSKIQKDEKTTISFVCSANYNRSAVAEVVFKHLLNKNGNQNIKILSAGVYYDERGESGVALSEMHAAKLMSKYGVEESLINSFKSQQFSGEHANADFVIASDKKHKEYVLKEFPHLKEKVFLFSDIVPDINDEKSILQVEYNTAKHMVNEVDIDERMYEFASRFFEGALIQDNFAEQNALNTKQKARRFYDISNSLSEADRTAAERELAGLYNSDTKKQNIMIDKWTQIPEPGDEKAQETLNNASKNWGKPGLIVRTEISDESLGGKLSGYIGKIEDWRRQNEANEKIIRPLDTDFLHMTLYYNLNFSKLQQVKDLAAFKNVELLNRIAAQLKAAGVVRDVEDIKDNEKNLTDTDREIVYSILEKAMNDVLAEIDKEGFEQPEFMIDGLAAFPGGADTQKTVLVLHTKPKTGYDFAVLMKVQEKFKNKTGIEDYDIFNGHITIGSFTSPFESKRQFKSFKSVLNSINKDIKIDSSVFTVKPELFRITLNQAVSGTTLTQKNAKSDEQNFTEIVKNAASFLSASEELTAAAPADILLLCGNDNVETFKKALELYKSGAAKKIAVSGGFGRLTIPVLKQAASMGIPVKVSDKLIISSLKDFEKNIAGLSENKQRKMFQQNNLSETKIILAILKHFAVQEGIDIPESDLIIDETARHTGENFTNDALKNAINALSKSKTKPVRLAYIQTPLQQLRTKGTFNISFKDMLKDKQIEGISTTVDVNYTDFNTNDALLIAVAGELLRIIVYGMNGIVDLNLGGIPDEIWVDAASLLEKSEIAQNNLKTVLSNLKQNGGPIYPAKENLLNDLNLTTAPEKYRTIKTFIEAIFIKEQSSKLEFYKHSRIADERGYAGVKRALYISFMEAFDALLPNFVKTHYPNGIIKDKNYFLRIIGDTAIKAASAAGLALGFVMPLSLPIAFIVGTALSFTFNILTHTFYNLIVDKNARLELGLPVKSVIMPAAILKNPKRTMNFETFDEFISVLNSEERQNVLKLLISVGTNDVSFLTRETPYEKLEHKFFLLYEIIEKITPEMINNMLNNTGTATSDQIEAANLIIENFWNTKGDENFERIKKRIQDDTKTTITFICAGNKNRSAVSHVLFEQMLRNNENKNISVLSAGIDAGIFSGDSFEERYSEILEGIIDSDIITSFASERFKESHLNSDFVIVSESGQKDFLLRKYPQIREKVFVFNELMPDIKNSNSVIDVESDREKGPQLVSTIYSFIDYFFDVKITQELQDMSILEKNIINLLSPKSAINMDFTHLFMKKPQEISDREIYEATKLPQGNLSDSLISFTFDSHNNAGDDNFENYFKLADSIASFIAEELTGRLEKQNNMINHEELEYAVYEILRNAVVHGNRLNLDRKIFIFINGNNDLYIINNDTPNDAIPLNKLAAASKQRIFGGGLGINHSEYLNGFRFSRTTAGNINLYVANLSMSKISKKTDAVLKKFNSNAFWEKTENIKRETFQAVKIPDFPDNHKISALSNRYMNGVTFDIVKRDGKFAIENVKKFKGSEKMKRLAIEDKLAVSEENGVFYVVSSYSGIIFDTASVKKLPSGQGYKVTKIKNAVLPENLDMVNRIAQKTKDAGGIVSALSFTFNIITRKLYNLVVSKNAGLNMSSKASRLVNTNIDEEKMAASADFFGIENGKMPAKYSEPGDIIVNLREHQGTFAEIHKKLLNILKDNKYAYVLDPEDYYLSVSNNGGPLLEKPASQKDVLKALEGTRQALNILSNIPNLADKKLKGRFDITANGQIVYILDDDSAIAKEFYKASAALPENWFRPDMLRMNLARLHTKPDQTTINELVEYLNSLNNNNPVEKSDYQGRIFYGQFGIIGNIIPQKAYSREFVNSILPLNLERPQKDKTAVNISVAVTFKEIAKSMLHPVEFIKAHPTKAGKAGAVILVGITSAAAIAVALFVPAAEYAAVALALVSGFAANITTHIIIDYHYIKASGLIDAVKEFGSAATLVQEGYINLPVYVVNEEPENYKELDLKPAGVSISGNPLWVDKSKGAVVVYANGANPQAIAQELASNRKINAVIKEHAGKGINMPMKNISLSFIEVDHIAASKESISYSESGNPKVSSDLVKSAAQNGKLTDFSASLRKNGNVDAFTFARGMVHSLDDVETLEDFKEYLFQHQKTGNGQIMITDSLYNSIKGSAFTRFLTEARKDGVQVFVLYSSQADSRELAAAGIAGYVNLNTLELNNFTLNSVSKVNVGKFDSLAALEYALKNSDGIFIINNSMFKQAVSKERDAISTGAIVEILSSVKILKIFHSKPVTEDFALNAARNFDVKDIPNLNENNIEALKTLINSKDFSVADFKSALGIKNNEFDPVSAYLMKLKTQTGNNAAVTNAFMRGIIEKALTAGVLRKAHKEYGLKDINYEIVLGRALYAKVQYDVSDVQPDITPDSFKTVKEGEAKLNETIAGLMPQAFDKKDAKAVNAIIELIPAFAQERKMAVITDKVKPTMNIRNYENILTAA